jgi:hypothetical protein
VAAAGKMAIGLDSNNVEQLLGKPDVTKTLMRKESQEIKGYSWVYLVYKEDVSNVNEIKDRWINVFFTTEMKVKDVDFHNVKE